MSKTNPYQSSSSQPNSATTVMSLMQIIKNLLVFVVSWSLAVSSFYICGLLAEGNWRATGVLVSASWYAICWLIVAEAGRKLFGNLLIGIFVAAVFPFCVWICSVFLFYLTIYAIHYWYVCIPMSILNYLATRLIAKAFEKFAV